jgi:AcrR family transcriptional regulator
MDRRILKTKKSITDAFLALIIEKGTKKIPVSEIAQRADISRKTFYLHYSSTADIVTDMEKGAREAIYARAVSFLKGGDQAKLDSVFSDFDELLAPYLPEMKQVVRSCYKSDFLLLAVEALKPSVILVLRDYCHVKEQDIPYYADFYSSGLSSLYLGWLEQENPVTASDLDRLCLSACFSGFIGEMERNKKTE